MALLVALASFCLCLRRKRMQKTQSPPRAISLQHNGQNPYQPTQLQQSTIPHYQPSETPPALSSFTRISSTGPEMSSVLSGGLQRHPSASSTSGFSLVRFFSKHSSPSTSVKAGRGVYLHSSRSSQYIVDMSSQKTPSVTSSARSPSRDYTWDLSLPSKEDSKGMFPIITLTSPTNSEVSIAIPLQEEPQAAFINSDTEPSTSSSGSQPSVTMSLGVMKQQDASSSMSAKTYSSPYQLEQSVPQHMLLHPSASYSRPTRLSEKQAPLPPSSTPTDFPPTYEEAVDASDSRSSSLSMQIKPIVTAHLAPQSAQLTGASSSSTSSSSAVQGHEGAATAWAEFSMDEAADSWAGDAGTEIETDPLASLTLPSNIANHLPPPTS
ncbi:hypothetical protein BGZ51_002558 [Haplosporangium sp. Z 767]|nr:hypothetical protein BGZ51_002558 [Haplosporangium sp. Z 767]